MAFEKAVKLLGDTDTYTISSDIKSYALRDLGFTISKRGTYSYEAPLDQKSPFTPAARLKITVSPELDSFKMNTVNQSGTMAVNIFSHDRADEFTEQLNFILANMIERDVVVKN